MKKTDQIRKLKEKLSKLRTQTKFRHHSQRSVFFISNVVLKSDVSVRLYTGIQTRARLNALYRYLLPKVGKMRDWYGSKKEASACPQFSQKGKKTNSRGRPDLRLTLKQEFIFVLMKLRMALTITFLASLFLISTGTASSIFNTWIKFLSTELRPLIFWPDKEQVLKCIPGSLKSKYPNLRCTVDCSEILIGRPRNLELQALTWSEYKHHNTVKFLIAIAPNGMVSFLSKAWGGRASDVLITKESVFYNLIDPCDTILADKGFTIKEELLLRKAFLEIPPPSKMLLKPKKKKKKKKIANARIHVERAIGRMKWFRILKDTLPITVLPVIDDIIVVFAALVNLLPPLVPS
ncbi:hypothetical protein HOLleu_01842 [Holothuria leucospilota]|uniref:DDE Tnp4 domain-containing protein n=1 Tax=Holothuria leucospilota TaxID=206669 RepID=A0A9Q1CQH0_HOLLE|nr:hypothetical protein HOLleu_01842 [Holothuria leucospilota]